MNTLHYLLMADHLSLQKQLFSYLKDTDLTLGQPKVLDYLKEHDGAVQKEIASACQIEPASLTSILNGMEKKGLISREMHGGNRRNLYVHMTDRGQEAMHRVDDAFREIEADALNGFTAGETEILLKLLTRIYSNLQKEKRNNND